MARTATQKGRLIVVAGSVLAAAAGAAALRADLMVSHGFGKVSVEQKAALPFELATSGSQLQAEVGDEAYWLTKAAFETPVPFDRRLAIGDRMTITGRDGRTRNLEVVDLKAGSAPILKIATGSVRLLQVICRVVDPAEGDRQELMHFFVAVEEPKPAPLPQPQVPLGRT